MLPAASPTIRQTGMPFSGHVNDAMFTDQREHLLEAAQAMLLGLARSSSDKDPNQLRKDLGNRTGRLTAADQVRRRSLQSAQWEKRNF